MNQFIQGLRPELKNFAILQWLDSLKEAKHRLSIHQAVFDELGAQRAMSNADRGRARRSYIKLLLPKAAFLHYFGEGGFELLQTEEKKAKEQCTVEEENIFTALETWRKSSQSRGSCLHFKTDKFAKLLKCFANSFNFKSAMKQALNR